MLTHTNTHVHTHAHTRTHRYTHMHTHAQHMHTQAHTHMHTHMHIHKHTHAHTHAHTYTHAYTHIHARAHAQMHTHLWNLQQLLQLYRYKSYAFDFKMFPIPTAHKHNTSQAAGVNLINSLTVKDQQMHHSFNVLVLNINTATCFSISKCHHQAVRYEHAEMVPNVVRAKTGWNIIKTVQCM
jgi:hypothetical protein